MRKTTPQNPENAMGINPTKLYSTSEAAPLLGYKSKQSVVNLISAGVIPFRQRTIGSHYRILGQDLINHNNKITHPATAYGKKAA